MNPNVKKMEAWMRASGFYCSQITDATTGEIGLFLDGRDEQSKADQKKILAMIARLDLKISVADKGACLFTR
jgi:hypothetical protein